NGPLNNQGQLVTAGDIFIQTSFLTLGAAQLIQTSNGSITITSVGLGTGLTIQAPSTSSGGLQATNGISLYADNGQSMLFQTSGLAGATLNLTGSAVTISTNGDVTVGSTVGGN